MLARLFDADRASLLTRLVLDAIETFDIDTSQLHNDSTSISFAGTHAVANGRTRGAKPTARVAHGHSKDHRPDLKQLVWILTVTADGTVPIAYRAVDGNTNDDVTHVQTWDGLVALTGDPGFLYVADSKLATRHDAASDGCFPVISNDRTMTGAALLIAYKYQPNLEKRHAQLKGTQLVAPVFLRDPARIEGLLCCHFIAMLIQALIERDIRNAMADRGLTQLSLYPEDRGCAAPTAARVLEIFTGVARHRLIHHGRLVQTFQPELTDLQSQVLDLLGIPHSAYTDLA